MKHLFFEALKIIISAVTVWLIFKAHPLGYSSFLILTIGLALVAAVLLLEAFLAEDCGEVCPKTLNRTLAKTQGVKLVVVEEIDPQGDEDAGQ